MDVKLFDLIIDPEDESGLSMVAVVDNPAIQRDFLTFREEFEETFNDYPESASNNAAKALKWIEEHKSEINCNFTRVGLSRANQLKNKENLSWDTIGRMASFNRHKKNAEVNAEYKDTPWRDCGYLAWLLWGGTSGVNWAINKMKQKNSFKFQVDNEEKRIASGYALLADVPIVRFDKDIGEHYVKFSKETISQLVDKFMQNGLNDQVNEMHETPVKDVFIIESIIVDKERGTKPPDMFAEAPEGSWWISMRVHNDEVWEKIKNGEYMGFSVEGLFAREAQKPVEKNELEKIIEQWDEKFTAEKFTSFLAKINQSKVYNKMTNEAKNKVNELVGKMRELFTKSEEVQEPTKEEFLEAQLEDGTLITVEPDLVVGAAVAVVGEEGSEPAPDAAHVLADGTVVVTEGGVIQSIEAPEEAAAEAVKEEEEEMNKETQEVKRQPEHTIERTEIEKKFAAMQEQIDALKAENEEFKQSEEKNREEFKQFAEFTTQGLESLASAPSADTSVKRKRDPFAKKSKNIFINK